MGKFSGVNKICFTEPDVIGSFCEDHQKIITLGAVITAIAVILGYVFKAFEFYRKQKQKDEEINYIKEENALICFALSACLDGLQQLGANHTVPVARKKLDEYLNQRAHK